MKRERLEELRKIKTGFDFVMGLTPDWAEGRRAGLTDDQTETIVNYVYQALSRNLLALIDSALAEPSDEDIDRALDWILTGKYETQVGDHSYVADSRFHPDTSRFCNTIAQALRQYQKPTDEAVRDCSTCIGCECEPELGETVKNCKCYIKREPTDEAVQDAISWLESDKIDRQREWEKQDTDWKLEPGAKEMHDSFMSAFDLAIQALCQMRSAPCWYCKGIESHGIKSVKTVTDESDRELGAYDTPYNFCPNCGRKIKEE